VSIRGLLICFLLIFCRFNPATSQELLKQYIQLPPQELSIEQYLFHIEEQTKIHLAYSSAIVEDKKIAIHSDSIQLKELLDTLFTRHSVKYIFQGNILVLSPQSEVLKRKSMIKITGVVANSKNNKPIPYANVFLPGQSNGTIANSEGAFELVLPASADIDSLVISSVGFNQETITASDFLLGPIEIKLDPQVLLIREVVVHPENPMDLLDGMLKNKPENYSHKEAMYSAFFREASRQDESYISLSEAIIDIHKTSYFTEENDLIRLIKGRRGSNIKESELVNLVVEGGLFNNLQLDLMKYGVSFLDPEYFYNYEYTLLKVITYNNRPTYVIAFKFKANIQLTGFDGKLYLDKNSLALVRAEFHLSEESLNQAYSLLVKKVPPAFKIRPRYGNYQVEYRFYDGNWNLSYARSEVALKMKKKREARKDGFLCQFVTSSEFVITGKAAEGFEKIKYRDASKPRDILYEQISETDPEFWGNETVILPDEPLNETIKKLRIENMTGESSLVKTDPPDQN
jgi:hypothetical protein